MSGPQEEGRWAPSKRGGVCSDDIGDDVAASGGGGGMSRLFTCARKGACVRAVGAGGQQDGGSAEPAQPSSGQAGRRPPRDRVRERRVLLIWQIARPAAKTADSEDERGTNAASQPSSLSFLTDKLGNSTAATASNLRSFISNRLPSTLPDTGWKDAIWSLPKRFFSSAPGKENSGFSSNEGSSFMGEGADLPKLPVPSVEQTISKYLQFARVILKDAEFERTRRCVQAFQTNEAPKLQAILLERHKNHDNWAYEWWLNDMYLGNPLALPINSNPGMVLPPRSPMNLSEQAALAARLATGLLKHKEILDHGGIPQERATSREKGQPLCMTQFYRLLTSCRVPSVPRDMLITEPCSPRSQEHIIVACKNQFYLVLLKKDGCAVSEENIAAAVQGIVKDANARFSMNNLQPAIGLLTTNRRDTWAQVREQLAQSDKNCENMELIQSSLALICMDEPLPVSFNYRGLSDEKGHRVGVRDETNMAHQMIHGGGSAHNSSNRWFDKTVQLILCSDGVWGLCYEHSPAEGVAMVQLVEQLHKQAQEPLTYSKTSIPAPQPLQWQMSGPLHQHIQSAANILNSSVQDLDFYVYRFTNYGKEYIKSCKVSPDAYIQLALQLAYFRLNRKLTATYESASTRRFQMGRVDCIRSASLEAMAWVEKMCHLEIENDNRNLLQQCLDLFDDAVTKQTSEMVDNILGQGIDIHLLGWKQAAKEQYQMEPDLFADDAFKKLNHFSLSTSQVGTVSDSFMGYGPVVPDGYGASYNPRKDSITFCLSAFISCESTSTWKFANSLEKSLLSMQRLLSTRIK
ncbi:choline O-acetyltransferase-like isoform X2 [Cloeon dipterum]|uniref:choline O-acetyltransferase-like isoform X2 n=1 Tax=Cloeon dipterum TaxID=197152 RepID=UPI003220448A